MTYSNSSFITSLLIFAGCLACAPAGATELGAELAPNLNLTISHASVDAGQTVKIKEITLNGLRDSGFTLQQLRQESIHLFQEATRTPVCSSTKPEVIYPHRISDKTLSEKTTYLPARLEWLMYYIGTMEPIIELFQEDIKDVRAGVMKRLVPKGTKDSFEPLIADWNVNITALNEHLDRLNTLTSQTKLDNLQIAKEAVAMYAIIERLEATRRKAFALIRSAERSPDSEKVEL
jgi:hypothetical protein